MAFDLVQKGICVFHITHVSNVPSIIKLGLFANTAVKKQHVTHHSVAHEHIQVRRQNTQVPCGGGGTLHDYVPLFFGARSPMLCGLKYRMDQREIVYVTINWNVLELDTTVFTDGNAATSGTQFFSGVQDLEKVDLNAARVWYWGGSEEESRKKAAEVLVYKHVTPIMINGFAVINSDMFNKVDAMLQAQNFKRKIIITPEYYY